MSLTVGELFAGIGGFGLAAQRAGAEVRWACEIDDFASRVYAARFPDVVRHGDVQVFDGDPVDCITAGFPCQDVSVAGKRKGLIGERTGLFWHIIRIADRLRPRWLLLENVPGLLSSHKGRDFETILAALDELGYGVAWRVLDAQFFGVPQRRRRVFIVGHLGAPCPAEVLFEPESMPRDLAAGGKARTGLTGGVAACLNSGGNDGGFRAEPGEHLVAAYQCHGSNVGPMGTLRAGNGNEGGGVPFLAHALSSEGADASEDGTGRGTPIVPVMFSDPRRHDVRGVHRGDIREMPCLNATNNDLLLAPTLRVGGREQGAGSSSDNTPIVAACLNPGHEAKHSYAGDGGTLNIVGIRPRRLTPRECERLQGFPDDWTLIDGASDSARYRALGNAVAVPVVEWILRRLINA